MRPCPPLSLLRYSAAICMLVMPAISPMARMMV